MANEQCKNGDNHQFKEYDGYQKCSVCGLFHCPIVAVKPLDSPSMEAIQRMLLEHCADLPEHERRISAKSLEMLEEGKQAVKEGRVRTIEMAELTEEEITKDGKRWGPSPIMKFLRACRFNNILEKWFARNKQ